MEMSNVSDSSRRGCVADWVAGGGVPVKSKRGGERDREEKEEINKASKGRGRLVCRKMNSERGEGGAAYHLCFFVWPFVN